MQKFQFYGAIRLGAQIGATVAGALLCTSSLQAQEVVTLGGGTGVALRNGFTTQARFNDPYGLALDASGNLYVADRLNNHVRKVTAAGDKTTSQTTSFITGLSRPVDVAIDSAGNLLVLTAGDGRIRKYGTAGTTGNLLSSAYPVLTAPSAFALDAVGNIYVTQANGLLRRITTNGVLETVTNGFNNPQGVTVLNSGLIAVSDTGNNVIRLVNPVTAAITHLSGSTNGTSGFADGTATVARFYQPHKIAEAPNGSLVVADRYNHRVRLLTTKGTASTIYGVNSNLWVSSYYPGWQEGTGTNAHAREPVGVVAANNGDVFATEIHWDLLRVARGGTTGGSGGGTNNPPGGTNNPANANSISFGFESGEASSDFVGLAGQHFYAPVTLTTASNQSIYTLQYNLAVTNLNSAPTVSQVPNWFTRILKPSLEGSFTPIEPNAFNSSQRLMTLGWYERVGKTNLYPTPSQDLVTYSMAHNRLYGKADNKVIMGGYGFSIPAPAQTAETYQIQIGRPSGTTDGIETPLTIEAPTNNALGEGTINALKHVTIGEPGSRKYIVGDTLPFRWLNSGEFGDGFILNSDIMQIFQSAVYGLNAPPNDSDFFDAMDASDGFDSGATAFPFNDQHILLQDDSFIDNLTKGDGKVLIDDVYVTYRRSLDPSYKWFARFWTNGVLGVEEVPNVFPSFASLATAQSAPEYAEDFNNGETPSVSLIAMDLVAGSATNVPVSIRAEIKGTLPIRLAMVNFTVEPLEDSPALDGVSFSSPLGTAALADSRGTGNYAAAWLNRGVAGISGTNNLGILNVVLPAGLPATAAYLIRIEHASTSPNGLGIFPQKTVNGLLTATDRSASSVGDGIADSWRLKHFGTISSNVLTVASADADGDGASNLHEYKAGTNPNDVSSILRLLDSKRTGGLTVRWPSVAGVNYVIESSPALFGEDWEEVSTNIAGTGEDLEYTDSTPNTGVRFYRVRVIE